MADVKQAKQDAKPRQHPNEGIDLSAFNYGEMVGKPFSDYRDLVEGKVLDEDDPERRRAGGLNAQKKYQFDVYKAQPVWRRLFPKSLVDTTVYLAGFNLVKDKPVRTTLTFLSYALNLNRQIESKQKAGSNAQEPTYDYYLLQKPTN